MEAQVNAPGFIEWLPGEMEIFRQLPEISTSEFAERHRTVTIGAHRGKWSNDITPYLTDIMDASDLPWVHTLVICGPEQSGKTNACINIHLKDLVYNGGNAKFIMFPTENLAKNVASSRLLPIYEQCEPIRRKFTSNPDDRAAGKISFRDGTIVFPAWATSAAKLSSFPSDFTWGDEVDKNSDLTGDESDALKLLEKRTRTFRSYLNLVCSTPTLETGHVWRALQECRDIKDYYVVCPSCQTLQLMEEARVTWPGQLTLLKAPASGTPEIPQPDADPKVIEQRRLARYACEGCPTLWDDLDRNRAVRAGAWVSREEIERPASVGFHITGFICPDISLSEIAAKIIQARTGGVSAEKERDNSYLGIPHRPKQSSARKEDSILRLVDSSMPRGVVPRETSVLLLLADTQMIGFYYQVWAYGWGRDLETWRIDHGYVERFEHLTDIAARTWLDPDKKEYRVLSAFIDSGGGTNPFNPKHSRTAEVYEFCRCNPMFKPLKGRRTQEQPWNTSKIDYFPSRQGKKIPIPGGLVLYTINVTIYKDDLARKLQIEPGDPGAFHLHAETGEDYARQMCAEYQDNRGWWECPKGKANHHWDIGVYGMAAADILRLKDKKKPVEGEVESKPKTQTVRRTGDFVNGF